MKYLLIVLLALFAMPVMAESETGIFFDPEYPGRGAFVYERDDLYFLSFFTHVRKCRHLGFKDSILAVDGELAFEEGYDRCRYHGYKRIQQWFITDLCPLIGGIQVICPIYMTVPYDDPELGAPLADVIDIGTAYINRTQCGFNMLIQYVPNPILDADADAYHTQYRLSEFVFGPSPLNPVNPACSD